MLLEDKGFLETENDMERTFKLKQSEIKKNVDIQTARKSFDIKLTDLGPYKVDYSRTGNHLLICGAKGHVAAFDWKQGQLESEIQLGETCRAAKWLQDDNQFYAVAQKKHVYIYDHTGAEIHKLKDHIDVTALEYLPFHYLLASAGNTGFLKYQDVSTGKLVSQHRTKLGPTQALTQNPYNAVLHLGHGNGTVSLWSPNVETPLVKLLVSRSPVRSIAIDREGKYMACASNERNIKIWDIRNFKQHLNVLPSPTPASSVHISDSGLLAVGFSSHVQIWKSPFSQNSSAIDKTSLYMEHSIPGSKIANIRFCPFEDVLGVGHADGLSSLIVPGAGEANFDGLEVNPYMNASREGRRENQVRSLMDKLQPEMIVLDPSTIGNASISEDTRRAGLMDPKLARRSNLSDRDTKKLERLERERKLKEQKEKEHERKALQKQQLGPALGRFL